MSRSQRNTTSRLPKDITMLSQRLKTNMTLATYSLMFDLSQSNRPSDVYVYEQIKCQNMPVTKRKVVAPAANWEEEGGNREVKNEIKLSADYDDDLFAIDANLDRDLDNLLLRFANNNNQQHQANTLLLDNELSCHS
ncbi:hypothetical protein K501DRAFT_334277 [Backusella circina FSU 941]|nr:hypothetical protein K501DRAFT_334277 [Backusella circina FSU 941]